MTSKHDIFRYVDLHERIQRFTEIAGALVQALNLEKSGGRGPRGEPASDRVVRDYVRRRVLSPTMLGSESDERGFYGFRHLVEFLAARVLLNDGWPLEKIAERNRSATTGELIALIPGQSPQNDAVALARSFRAPAGAVPVPPPSHFSPPDLSMSPPVAAMAPMYSPMFDPMLTKARSHAELPLLMRQLAASPTPPRIAKLISIALGDQITLLIDQAMVRDMSATQADLIGRTVTAALIDFQNLSKARSTPDDD